MTSMATFTEHVFRYYQEFIFNPNAGSQEREKFSRCYIVFRELIVHWLDTPYEYLLSQLLSLIKTVFLFEFDLAEARINWVMTRDEF